MFIRQGVQERVHRRVDVPEPDGRRDDAFGHARSTEGHDHVQDEVGQKAARETEDDGEQLSKGFLLLVPNGGLLDLVRQVMVDVGVRMGQHVRRDAATLQIERRDGRLPATRRRGHG